MLELRRCEDGWQPVIRCDWCERPASNASAALVVYRSNENEAPARYCCGWQCARALTDGDPGGWEAVRLRALVNAQAGQFSPLRAKPVATHLAWPDVGSVVTTELAGYIVLARVTANGRTDGWLRLRPLASGHAVNRWDTWRRVDQIALALAPPSLSALGNNRRRGSQNHAAKLTEADVVAMREQAAAGTKQGELAAIYGVNRLTVGRLIRGDTWSHVR
jgi:hypothetical protein